MDEYSPIEPLPAGPCLRYEDLVKFGEVIRRMEAVCKADRERFVLWPNPTPYFTSHPDGTWECGYCSNDTTRPPINPKVTFIEDLPTEPSSTPQEPSEGQR